jgi:5-hydroxyisourate hydrolase
VSLSSHVLDGTRGEPAAGVFVRWEHLVDGQWKRVAQAETGADGRIAHWGVSTTSTGTHRLVFGSGEYFAARGVDTFYPEVVVVFTVTDPDRHHHVPLLLSPFAYSTYRGS